MNENIIEDKFLENIKEVRNILKPQIDKYLINFDKSKTKGYRQKLNTITDGLVFLAFKVSDKFDKVNSKNNLIVSKVFDEKFCSNFMKDLEEKKITIQNVLDTAITTFDIEKKPEYNLDYILTNNDLSTRPDISVGMQMYLLKGKFKLIKT